jgi:hypothetical protein
MCVSLYCLSYDAWFREQIRTIGDATRPVLAYRNTSITHITPVMVVVTALGSLLIAVHASYLRKTTGQNSVHYNTDTSQNLESPSLKHKCIIESGIPCITTWIHMRTVFSTKFRDKSWKKYIKILKSAMPQKTPNTLQRNEKCFNFIFQCRRGVRMHTHTTGA